MDDDRSKLGGSKLKEFKNNVAEQAAAFLKFRETLRRVLPTKQEKRFRTKPHGLRKAERRRKNKAARQARRNNRRSK